MLEYLAAKFGFPDFEENASLKLRMSKGEIAGEKISLVEPNNFMNRSGASLAALVKNNAQAKKLVIIYDDLDLPLGKIKLSFNKSSGGHRGLDSIIKALKTQEFIRIRVGITPTTPSGKLKKPKGETDVEKHIIGEFKKPELDIIKKISKQVTELVEKLVAEGYEKTVSTQ